MAALGTALLLLRSAALGKWLLFGLFAVYGLSMVCLYTASTLYHCLNVQKKPNFCCVSSISQGGENINKAVEFQMYALVDANGNGTNYIKLRDMAQVLNGTKAQFSVGYDNASKSVVGSGSGVEGPLVTAAL